MELDLDTMDVIDLEPWHAPAASAPGYWPCGMCGAPHDVTRSWNLTCQARHERFALIICESCAATAARHR